MTAARATWAFLVIAVSFGEAIWRLGARALHVLPDLHGWRVAALVVVVALFVWGEGYRALQRRFVPSVVARAFDPSGAGVLRFALAPFYALSLYAAPARTIARAWIGIALIVIAVLVVRAMPEPWRGIVDAGVAAALTWGLASMCVQFVRALRSPQTQSSPREGVVVRDASVEERVRANAIYDRISFVRTKDGDVQLVALVDGELAGLGRLVDVGRGVELGGIWTREDLRGRGVARAIVGALLSRARADGVNDVWCVPFAKLESYYASFGLAVIADRAQWPPGIAAKVDDCVTRKLPPVVVMRAQR